MKLREGDLFDSTDVSEFIANLEDLLQRNDVKPKDWCMNLLMNTVSKEQAIICKFDAYVADDWTAPKKEIKREYRDGDSDEKKRSLDYLVASAKLVRAARLRLKAFIREFRRIGNELLQEETVTGKALVRAFFEAFTDEVQRELWKERSEDDKGDVTFAKVTAKALEIASLQEDQETYMAPADAASIQQLAVRQARRADRSKEDKTKLSDEVIAAMEELRNTGVPAAIAYQTIEKSQERRWKDLRANGLQYAMALQRIGDKFPVGGPWFLAQGPQPSEQCRASNAGMGQQQSTTTFQPTTTGQQQPQPASSYTQNQPLQAAAPMVCYSCGSASQQYANRCPGMEPLIKDSTCHFSFAVRAFCLGREGQDTNKLERIQGLSRFGLGGRTYPDQIRERQQQGAPSAPLHSGASEGVRTVANMSLSASSYFAEYDRVKDMVEAKGLGAVTRNQRQELGKEKAAVRDLPSKTHKATVKTSRIVSFSLKWWRMSRRDRINI